MSVGAFPPCRNGNPSYSQHTPAVRGFRDYGPFAQGLSAVPLRSGWTRRAPRHESDPPPRCVLWSAVPQALERRFGSAIGSLWREKKKRRQAGALQNFRRSYQLASLHFSPSRFARLSAAADPREPFGAPVTPQPHPPRAMTLTIIAPNRRDPPHHSSFKLSPQPSPPPYSSIRTGVPCLTRWKNSGAISDGRRTAVSVAGYPGRRPACKANPSGESRR